MPEKARRSTHRGVASILAASAVGLAMFPLLGAAPAVAAPQSPASNCPAVDLHGSAAADLLRLDLLDLRPLGVKLGPLAAVRLASTRSGLSGTPRSSVAAARYLDASVLGLASVPTSTAIQQAPPANPHAEQRTAAAVNVPGVLRAGIGKLTAAAPWPDRNHCTLRTGQTSASSASIADATVLPNDASSTSLVRVPDALNSGTATGLVVQDGRTGVAAGARAGLADLRLFAGTGAEIGVQVITEPTLTAIAGASAGGPSVRYTSPILKVTLPGGQVQRLDAPGAHLDIAVPPPASANASAHESAGRRAAAEGLPVLGGDPLGALLTGLHPGDLRTAGTTAGSSTGSGTPAEQGDHAGNGDQAGKGAGPGGRAHGSAGPLGLTGLPVLPGLPAVGGLPVLGGESQGGGAAGGVAGDATGDATGALPAEAITLPGSSSLAVLRLSIGSLDQRITATSAHAQAATLRLQLLLQPTGTARGAVTLLDLGIGVLETAATAATATVPAAPRQPPVATALPVTGASLTWVIIGGVLLAAAGRLLMMLGRRKSSD